MAEETPFHISEEDAKNFGLALLVMTAAFTAFFRDFQIASILFFGVVSALALGVRELSHRAIAYLMNAYNQLEFSRNSAILSIITAILAVAFDLPLIFLAPVWSEFENKQYESWGYEVDVIWAKREYWFAATGITFLIVIGTLAYYFGYERASLAISLFTAFQLLPFYENSLVEGSLDGAQILLQTGFMWLLFFGASIVGIALSI